jgi:hyperosmotically inducible periplasmic protein
MKLTKVLMTVVVATSLFFVSCTPKDADIKAKIEAALKDKPDMAGMTIDVKDGVATLSGECKDEACKATCLKAVEDLKIKGVKSVVSNCTIKPAEVIAPPASVAVSSLAADVQQKIKDGLKDIKGLTSVDFSDKGAVLIGEVTKADNLKIKQILGAAKVALDAAASKLTIK